MSRVRRSSSLHTASVVSTMGSVSSFTVISVALFGCVWTELELCLLLTHLVGVYRLVIVSSLLSKLALSLVLLLSNQFVALEACLGLFGLLSFVFSTSLCVYSSPHLFLSNFSHFWLKLDFLLHLCCIIVPAILLGFRILGSFQAPAVHTPASIQAHGLHRHVRTVVMLCAEASCGRQLNVPAALFATESVTTADEESIWSLFKQTIAHYVGDVTNSSIPISERLEPLNQRLSAILAAVSLKSKADSSELQLDLSSPSVAIRSLCCAAVVMLVQGVSYAALTCSDVIYGVVTSIRTRTHRFSRQFNAAQSESDIMTALSGIFDPLQPDEHLLQSEQPTAPRTASLSAGDIGVFVRRCSHCRAVLFVFCDSVCAHRGLTSVCSASPSSPTNYTPSAESVSNGSPFTPRQCLDFTSPLQRRRSEVASPTTLIESTHQEDCDGDLYLCVHCR